MNEPHKTPTEKFFESVMAEIRQKPTKMLAQEYQKAKERGEVVLVEILKQELKRRN